MSINTSSKELADDIKSTVIDLCYNKYEWWSNPKNCEKLELFYRDKLMGFEKDVLTGTALIVGIPYEYDYSKKELCNKIIEHYKKRSSLMKKIFNGVNKTQNMINKLNNGEMCVGVDQFVDNWNLCKQVNGGWIGREKYQQILDKIKSNSMYEKYYGVIEQFEQHYYKSLLLLHKLLYKIKEDVDNKMIDEEYNIMEQEISTLVDKMVSKCESFYLIGSSLLNLKLD